jgi:hypothetical protein
MLVVSMVESITPTWELLMVGGGWCMVYSDYTDVGAVDGGVQYEYSMSTV